MYCSNKYFRYDGSVLLFSVWIAGKLVLEADWKTLIELSFYISRDGISAIRHSLQIYWQFHWGNNSTKSKIILLWVLTMTDNWSNRLRQEGVNAVPAFVRGQMMMKIQTDVPTVSCIRILFIGKLSYDFIATWCDVIPDKFVWDRYQKTDQLLPPGKWESVWRIYANLIHKVEFVLIKRVLHLLPDIIRAFYRPDFDSLLISSVEFTWFWQQA